MPSPLPHDPDPALLESFRYVNSIPGKNVRGKMIDCFQLWLAIDESSKPEVKVLNSVKEIIGDLHNASLMIDDIEDNSVLRRGIPVTHSIFGVPTTINTANYAYFLALEKCHALQNSQAMTVFVGELLNLHRGQGRDIMWREQGQCPTEQEYLKMVQDKTGGLFRLAVGLMQAFATTNVTTDYTTLVNNLAVYFQIRDDYINLVDEDYMKSKSFCEDLTEGKFSYPVIHCIRKNPDDNRLLSILKQRTGDIYVKRYAQQIMVEAGSVEYTREKCTSLKKEIVADIEKLGGNAPLMKLVEALDVQIQQLKTPLQPKETSP
eukprot:jgi/Psemu1/29177/gm1.29177_g